MEDEQLVEATTAPSEPTGQGGAESGPDSAPPSAAALAPETAAPDWRTSVDTADVAELRRHPRVAGILGSEIERERRNITERIAAEQQTKAQAEAQAELERLAQEDPDEFSRRYLAQTEQTRIQAQMDGLKIEARDGVVKQVGAAFNTLPEWHEIATDPKAQERLATALAGKADDEVIATFNATAIDLVVEKRAAVQAQARYDAQIAREREAMRAEIIAEMNRSGVAPGITRSNGTPNRSRLDSLPAGKEFNDEYERVYGIR